MVLTNLAAKCPHSSETKLLNQNTETMILRVCELKLYCLHCTAGNWGFGHIY